ncbi:hypothetical protein [Streptomyces melanogenes]|uniref:Uncharacterized protein n=1 Tax=Streptomyces melanogenes TaxID=67326 RepID=A0ABZ1XS72_9ACTN|nr:hypothetical protein [Streptomyces melanogenes]
MHEMRAERDPGGAGAAGRSALLWHVMSADEPRTMCGRTLGRPDAAVPPDPDLSDADRYCAACMAAC